MSKNLSHPILKIYLKHYFTFKKICAELTTSGTIRNQEIFIYSHSLEFIMREGAPKKEYSQGDTINLINLSDWRSSLSEYITSANTIIYFLYKKTSVDSIVRKNLVDVSCDIFSKCAVLIKHGFKENWLEFCNIKKKMYISIPLMWKRGIHEGEVIKNRV